MTQRAEEHDIREEIQATNWITCNLQKHKLSVMYIHLQKGDMLHTLHPPTFVKTQAAQHNVYMHESFCQVMAYNYVRDTWNYEE